MTDLLSMLTTTLYEVRFMSSNYFDIKNIVTKETFYLSLNHPDLESKVDKVTIIEDLNKLKENKWVFNIKGIN